MISSIALAAILTWAAPKAHAQYEHSGALEWNYQDMALRTPGGTRHAASWSQAYNFSVFGPLGSPLIGTGSESVSFDQGHTLSQLAANANSKQEIVGYSFAWSLLPEALRHIITVDPSFARNRSTLAWGQPAQLRSLVDTTEALNLGLTLPKLPTLKVTRSIFSRRDQSPSPAVDQSTRQNREEAGYQRGPLYALYRHDRASTDDRLAASGGNFSDQKNGELDLNWYGLKRGLENVSLRTTYDGRSSGLGSRVLARQESATENASVTTRRWATGPWSSYLHLSQEFARDLIRAGNARQEVGELSSERRLGGGRLDNQARYTRLEGRARQENMSDSLLFEGPLWRTSYHGGGSLGWSWSPGSGKILSDSAAQRFTFPLSRLQTAYLEQGISGSTPLSGQVGGSRSYFGGAGSNIRYYSAFSFSTNYQARRSLNLATGVHGLQHALTNDLRFYPVPDVAADLTYNVTWNQGPGGAPARVQYLAASLSYVVDGLELSSGLNSSIVSSYDAFAKAKYTIGMTTVELDGERRALSTPAPYWLWSVRLRRAI